MSKNRQTTLRIIGGKWRGRKIKVCQTQHIRPTTDQIRETLFNWLAPIIQDTLCLDLFAGSGALGFEALSRGAKHVTFMDQSQQVIDALAANAGMLAADNVTFLCKKFTPNIANPFTHQFNVIFIDPPFHQNLIEPCINWLDKNNCLAKNAYIYIETEKELEKSFLPGNWEILREKITGQVHYYLVKHLN